MTIKPRNLNACEQRIEILFRELMVLSAEYTPERYARWLEIQNALKDLYVLKNRFLDKTQVYETSNVEELLY